MFESLSDAGVIAAALIAPPSGELIEALACIDPGGVSDSAQVDLIVAWERQSAWVTSRQQPALVAVAATAIASGWDQPYEESGSGRGEIGAALRITSFSASLRLTVAEELCGRLAAVQAALAAGEISYWYAKAIAESTEQLADDKAVAVAAKVLLQAPRQSVAELKRGLRRAVLRADPKSAVERAAKAHAERSLDWWPLADGMAEMRVITSAADMMAMVNVIDTFAR